MDLTGLFFSSSETQTIQFWGAMVHTSTLNKLNTTYFTIGFTYSLYVCQFSLFTLSYIMWIKNLHQLLSIYSQRDIFTSCPSSVGFSRSPSTLSSQQLRLDHHGKKLLGWTCWWQKTPIFKWWNHMKSPCSRFLGSWCNGSLQSPKFFVLSSFSRRSYVISKGFYCQPRMLQFKPGSPFQTFF